MLIVALLAVGALFSFGVIRILRAGSSISAALGGKPRRKFVTTAKVSGANFFLAWHRSHIEPHNGSKCRIMVSLLQARIFGIKDAFHAFVWQTRTAL